MDSLVGKFGLNIIKVDAQERFLSKLKGVTEPEKKRKIIGNEFIQVFNDEARKLDGIDFWRKGPFTPTWLRVEPILPRRSNRTITWADCQKT